MQSSLKRGIIVGIGFILQITLTVFSRIYKNNRIILFRIKFNNSPIYN